jgi:hypothetical protein
MCWMLFWGKSFSPFIGAFGPRIQRLDGTLRIKLGIRTHGQLELATARLICLNKNPSQSEAPSSDQLWVREA